MKKKKAHHRIYANFVTTDTGYVLSQPTPDTSLSYADCKLAPTANSTFELVLVGEIRPDRWPKFQHIPTDCSRLTDFMPTSR